MHLELTCTGSRHVRSKWMDDHKKKERKAYIRWFATLQYCINHLLSSPQKAGEPLLWHYNFVACIANVKGNEKGHILKDPFIDFTANSFID